MCENAHPMKYMCVSGRHRAQSLYIENVRSPTMVMMMIKLTTDIIIYAFMKEKTLTHASHTPKHKHKLEQCV